MDEFLISYFLKGKLENVYYLGNYFALQMYLKL